LQKAIKSPQFMAKSINGEVKFLANGDRAGKALILQVKPSPSHATGYDFVPIAP
jgi:branched-chain amino acid transport system substrate-binding protein